MLAFTRTIGAAYAAYRADPAGWSAASAAAIARITGAPAADVPQLLTGYRFPLLAEQAGADLLRLDLLKYLVPEIYGAAGRARTAKKRKAIVPLFGPVLAGGRLAVAGGDGELRFFDPVDGTLVGGVDVPGGAASSR